MYWMKFVSNIIKLYGFEKLEELRDKLSFSETEPLTLSLSLSLSLITKQLSLKALRLACEMNVRNFG